MDFVYLTQEQRRSFAENGFLVVPNALSAAEVERLVESTDRLAKSLLDKPPMTGRPEYNHLDFHQPNSGITVIARGSHLKHTALGLPQGEVDPADVEVCDLRLNAGDAFLFENRIFHSASPNRSTRVAKTLMYGYAYRWMKPEV